MVLENSSRFSAREGEWFNLKMLLYFFFKEYWQVECFIRSRAKAIFCSFKNYIYDNKYRILK